jgi:hypothetical protein
MSVRAGESVSRPGVLTRRLAPFVGAGRPDSEPTRRRLDGSIPLASSTLFKKNQSPPAARDPLPLFLTSGTELGSSRADGVGFDQPAEAHLLFRPHPNKLQAEPSVECPPNRRQIHRHGGIVIRNENAESQ